ncbi:MAG: hypothetical protein IJR47_04630 [Clostridia bacterium]|nr:hypothetical protein [Clostridia bacterium]
MKIFKHILVVLISLFVVLGIPAFIYGDFSAMGFGKEIVVSGASLVIPSAPSGEFLVLINTKDRQNTLDSWKVFFADGNAGVILEDITCSTVKGDIKALELAERYRARLPENQLVLKQEDGLLLVSKAECGAFDVIVISKEAAQGYNLNTDIADTAVLAVKGE